MKKKSINNKDLSRSTISDIIITYSFLIFLSLPITFFLLDIHVDFESTEKRILAEEPVFDIHSLSRFSEKYESYFNDHFPFRNILVSFNNLWKYKVLSVSGIPKVVVGDNGWLFLKSTLDDYEGNKHPISDNQLLSIKKKLEERQAWLSERNITYVLVIMPDKSTIYHEYVPKNLRRNLNQQARSTQLIYFLKNNTTLKIIDLRHSLLKAKEKNQLYYKTGTHLNHYGAYIAYTEIVAELNNLSESFPPKKLTDFRLIKTHSYDSGLVHMLGIDKFNILYETSIEFVPKEPRLAETASINYNNPNPIRPFIAKSVNNPDLPTAVFFRDSFIIALIPFLSEHYNRSVYPWVRYNQTIIEMESPDIVVTEIIERNLGRI